MRQLIGMNGKIIATFDDDGNYIDTEKEYLRELFQGDTAGFVRYSERVRGIHTRLCQLKEKYQ